MIPNLISFRKDQGFPSHLKSFFEGGALSRLSGSIQLVLVDSEVGPETRMRIRDLASKHQVVVMGPGAQNPIWSDGVLQGGVTFVADTATESFLAAVLAGF